MEAKQRVGDHLSHNALCNTAPLYKLDVHTGCQMKLFHYCLCTLWCSCS